MAGWFQTTQQICVGILLKATAWLANGKTVFARAAAINRHTLIMTGNTFGRGFCDICDAVQASADPGATWSLNVRQPWALKEAKATELTEEQKEFMANIQKEKDEQGGGAHMNQSPQAADGSCVSDQCAGA